MSGVKKRGEERLVEVILFTQETSWRKVIGYFKTQLSYIKINAVAAAVAGSTAPSEFSKLEL